MTEECLLDPSRNPSLGKEGIEKLLQEYLGIDKVIWLWKGMAGACCVVLCLFLSYAGANLRVAHTLALVPCLSVAAHLNATLPPTDCLPLCYKHTCITHPPR